MREFGLREGYEQSGGRVSFSRGNNSDIDVCFCPDLWVRYLCLMSVHFFIHSLIKIFVINIYLQYGRHNAKSERITGSLGSVTPGTSLALLFL